MTKFKRIFSSSIKFFFIMIMIVCLFIGHCEILLRANTTTIKVDNVQKYGGNTTGAYVGLNNTVLALMSNYMPFSNATLYSGTSIISITINSRESGSINIGTAKISDVITARKNGLVLNANTNTYNVVTGTNVIKVNLEIGSDETLVLSGKGISLECGNTNIDGTELGYYTMIDGIKHSDLNTNSALNIEVLFGSSNEMSLMEGISTNVTSSMISSGSTANVTAGYEPFILGDKTKFENKKISKIGIGVKSVAAIDDNQTFTIYKLNVSDMRTTNVVNNSYTLKLPKEALEGGTLDSDNRYTLNKWVYVDISALNIEVGSGETLAFGSNDDLVIWSYGSSDSSDDSFYINTQKTSMSLSKKYLLYLDIICESTQSFDSNKHLEQLKKNETTVKLKSILGNKKLSILGDSISTFEGYSNDATNANSTIGNNEVYYGGTGNLGSNVLNNVNQTWWMKVSSQLGVDILVNNSWSGSEVLASDEDGGSYGKRSKNLHDNIGSNAGTNPDLVAVYMGTNDAHLKISVGTYDKDKINEFLKSGKAPTTFAEAYAVMLNNIISEYGDIDIYCFTLLHFKRVSDANTETYNEIIRKLAEHFNLTVVDLYNDCNVSLNSTYFGESTYTHPNEAGMTEIANTFINTLAEKYENYEFKDDVMPDNNTDIVNPGTGISYIELLLLFGVVIGLITFISISVNKERKLN